MVSAHTPFSSRIPSLKSENEQKPFNLYILITPRCTCYARYAENAVLTLSNDFSLSNKSTFSLQWTKMPDRSQALQSIALLYFWSSCLDREPANYTQLVALTYSTLWSKYFSIHNSPFYVMLGPMWNAHFSSCTFLKAIAHTCLQFSLLLFGLEHFKMTLQVRPASQSAAALTPWRQVLRQWEFSHSTLMAPCFIQRFRVCSEIWEACVPGTSSK